MYFIQHIIIHYQPAQPMRSPRNRAHKIVLSLSTQKCIHRQTMQQSNPLLQKTHNQQFFYAVFTTFGTCSSSVLNTQSQKRLVTPKPF